MNDFIFSIEILLTNGGHYFPFRLFLLHILDILDIIHNIHNKQVSMMRRTPLFFFFFLTFILTGYYQNQQGYDSHAYSSGGYTAGAQPYSAGGAQQYPATGAYPSADQHSYMPPTSAAYHPTTPAAPSHATGYEGYQSGGYQQSGYNNNYTSPAAGGAYQQAPVTPVPPQQTVTPAAAPYTSPVAQGGSYDAHRGYDTTHLNPNLAMMTSYTASYYAQAPLPTGNLENRLPDQVCC